MEASSILGASELALGVLINGGLFLSVFLVLLMQPGFMLLEVGSISRLNVVNDI